MFFVSWPKQNDDLAGWTLVWVTRYLGADFGVGNLDLGVDFGVGDLDLGVDFGVGDLDFGVGDLDLDRDLDFRFGLRFGLRSDLHSELPSEADVDVELDLLTRSSSRRARASLAFALRSFRLSRSLCCRQPSRCIR